MLCQVSVPQRRDKIHVPNCLELYLFSKISQIGPEKLIIYRFFFFLIVCLYKGGVGGVLGIGELI